MRKANMCSYNIYNASQPVPVLCSKLNGKGFTLIEVMIAMVVAVMVLVGFVGANGNLRQTSESMFEKSVALQDANQVIELMRNAAASGSFPANVIASYPNGGTVSGFSNLTNETITVSYASASANPLNTTVTVSWLRNGARSVSTTLRTYITQRS